MHKKSNRSAGLVTMPPDGSVLDAARLMKKHAVGDVIVVEEQPDGRQLPVGIVTDRDIIVSVIADAIPTDAVKLGDIMSADLVVAHKESSCMELISQMRMHGVKRIPIVDKAGYLEDIVSADDLLEVVAQELAGLAKMPVKERKIERERRYSHL